MAAPARSEAVLDPPADIRGGILRGITWNLGGSFALQAIRAATSIALARMLAPETYGLARMVLVLGPLVLVLSDLGLGMGLIQRNTTTQTDRSTIFWASAGLGAVWTGIGVAAAGLAAGFFNKPQLTPMFEVYSVTFLLGSLGATHAVLLQRAADFRGLQLRYLAATVVSGAAAVAAAAAGWGAWAVILQQVVMSAADTALLWYFSSWRPSFTFSTASLRSFGGFGLGIFGTRLMWFFNRNTDNVLVGRYLGSSPLGMYSLAYNVMLMPFARLMIPVQSTLSPYIMRMQDRPERMTDLWLRSMRLAAAVVMPAIVGLILVAPDLIDVLVGPAWHRAARVLQVLAIAALLQSLTMSVPDILSATGRVSTLFRYSILSTVLQVGGFAIGLHWGLIGVAASYAISNAFLAPFFIWLGGRGLGIEWRRFARPLVSVAAATACMGLPTLALRLALVRTSTPPALRLAAVVAFGAVAYAIVFCWRERAVVADLRQFVRVRSS